MSVAALAVLVLSALRAPDVVPAGTSLRLEHFVLEFRDASPAIGPPRASASNKSPRDAGWVCLRRRAIDGGIQLECEIVFSRREASDGAGEANPGEGTSSERAPNGADDEHVLHVEHLASDGARLVWREWGVCRGRTVTAEWSSDGTDLRIVEAGRGGSPRETVEAGEGAVLPLYLLELAREGRVTSGTFRRLDPLARRLEEVELRTSYRTEPGVPLRRVEMLRGDGTLAGRFEFQGSELWRFQWQDGDLEARRVSAEEYAARSAAPSSDRRL